MATANPAPDETIPQDNPVLRRAPLVWRIGIGLLVVGALLVVSFEVVYAGKIYPGVSADGIYLGGLDKSDGAARLTEKLTDFKSETIPVNYGKTTLRIPVNALDISYDQARSVKDAYGYGREGGLLTRLGQQLRALLGRPTNVAAYSYDDNKLAPYVLQVADDVATPVADASLDFRDNETRVTDSKTGYRLDLGQLVQRIDSSIAYSDSDGVAAPVYGVQPLITADDLAQTASQADAYLSAPLELSYGSSSREITQSTIASWINVTRPPERTFLVTHKLEDLYRPPANLSLGLSKTAVAGYVSDLSGKVDQPPQNAGLSMVNGALTVTRASREGVKLDQQASIDAITKAVGAKGDGRTITLKADVTKADVREDNLDQLGIKEQLSEGETYFPGSPSTRLINVRAGAAKFDGVLLAPGEQFSFGKILGEVDASTGYVPELVILGDHEEKQYGGGLCQVSSTAFRAALAAGLPINERVNHAFAISYYTWPYSAPGVDATIYYPQVDFKFTNDTGHYLLMQTTMSGVDLKFDFYGTKTKSGVVRGPNFVTGSSDATVPSHTVFYRDVLDLAGNVIKTDTFNTYYQSSKDFPIQKQFN